MRHIAVIDVGKTNKKLLIYDEQLQLIDKRSIQIEENESDGIRHDNVSALQEWLTAGFNELSKKYNIRSVNVSAHGATCVCVNERMRMTVPEISYTTDPGDEFHEAFYAEFGDRISLQQHACTPDFNLLINTAKGIWFAKNRYPDQFAKTKYILNFPQFFSAWLTGIPTVDPTYVGNHSYLWDFANHTWSDVAKKMGIMHLLPKNIVAPWKVIGTVSPEMSAETGLAPDTLVTSGIHDSNSSMLPYLLTMQEDFILNSTGTWCVVMHEEDKARFAKDELGKVVFYNMNAFSKPVKTAIFLGGLEFGTYMDVLKNIHPDAEYPAYNHSLAQKIVEEKSLFILPSVARGIGQFPDSLPRIVEGDKVFSFQDVEAGHQTPEFFKDFETAYMVLNLSLAMQTKISFDRAGMTDGMPVFTEGGFVRNDVYLSLITAFYPQSTFATTNLDEATAYGAALLGKCAIDGVEPKELAHLIHIEKKEVNKVRLEGVQEYYQKFIELAES